MAINFKNLRRPSAPTGDCAATSVDSDSGIGHLDACRPTSVVGGSGSTGRQYCKYTTYPPAKRIEPLTFVVCWVLSSGRGSRRGSGSGARRRGGGSLTLAPTPPVAGIGR